MALTIPFHMCNPYLRCMYRIDEEVRSILDTFQGMMDAGLSASRAWREPIAPVIDHTNLRPEAAEPDIRRLCEEAGQHGFASVCVYPCFVPLCAELLADAAPAVCTVVGFPHGASTSSTKAAETRLAVEAGAREIDMVLRIGALKEGRLQVVFDDIRAVTDAAHSAHPDTIVKVILETCLLDTEQKISACLLARDAGAHFVKTSTGFSTGGATAADVRLMALAVGGRLRVKASGGIRTRADALLMLGHGADRLGSSASVVIIEP